MFNARKYKFRHAAKALVIAIGISVGWLPVTAGAEVELSQVPLFLANASLPPNVLLIPDTSESMQEGIDGRAAMDWDNPACRPGPLLSATECPAGARYENSKASIVKRTALGLVDRFRGRVNMGLMSYQQNPASLQRDSFNAGGTVRWRLVQRAVDVRYSTNSNPSWYDPDFDGAWDSPTKRYRAQHPTNSNIWIFYNDGIPGYFWDMAQDGSSGTPAFDRTEYRHFTGNTMEDNPPDGFQNRRYSGIRVSPSNNNLEPDSGLYYTGDQGLINTFLVDSQRQRGISSWGQRMVQMQLNQLEWRSTTSPGLGYLHVPLGGFTEDGGIDDAHWARVVAKLQPQRVDWNANAMTDPTWPLIASGLTPLEGTMHTARDYFLGRTGSQSSFRSDQGRTNNNMPIPETCNADNAVIWITDGLPSVDANGNSLGDNPPLALERARNAVADFYEATEAEFGRGVKTHVVGFALPPGISSIPGMPEDPLGLLAQAGGTGQAYIAGDEQGLRDIMDTVLRQIIVEASASASSVAANSTRLDVDGLIYQARFNSANWSGDLLAYRLREDGSIRSEPAWSAADLLDAPGFSVATRRVFTSNDSNQRIDFRYNQLGQVSGAVAAMNFDGRGADRVNYLRGDRSQELQNGGPFRARESRLGDIVNSDPAYMGRETFGYQGLPGTEGSSYPQYVRSKRNNPDRPPVLFVGANDGMLHAFHADTGEELFAYVPRMLINQMAQLSSPDYTHRYYVDGAPTVSDVYINGQWRTILVGTLGAGGRGIFALDVTNPRDPQVLWEFQHPELGEGVTQPSVLRIQTGNNNAGEWIVAVGNGYNSQSNQSGVILINAATGTHRQTILTGQGSAGNPNGMAPLLAINSSGGRIANTLYAGDLHGNLWKFDQVPQGSGRWNFRVANGGAELFQGRASPGNRVQPITSMPEAALNEDGEVMIIFGTGKYLGPDDVELTANNNILNAAYAIIDDGSSGLRRSDLHQQRIVYEDVSNGRQVRGVTTDPRPDNKKGWYLDLVPPSGQRQGERIVVRPVLRGNAVVFSTLIPSDIPCDTGGTSWLMALDIDNGTAVMDGFFDINDDGVINEDDFIMVDGQLIPVAGLGSESGILTRANFLSGSEGMDVGYLSDSTGNTQRVRVRGNAFNLGRQSWRQIR